VLDSIRFCQKEKGFELFAWCIMSNHVHLIARAKEGFHLQHIIRDLKKFTSKQITRQIEDNTQESRKSWLLAIYKSAGEYNSNNTSYQFWRQDNKPIELYTPAVIKQKLEYIHDNPVEAGIVDNPEDYVYSSARDYAGIKGLLDLTLL
jgi:REP element-mobilizing transposase RayT